MAYYQIFEEYLNRRRIIYTKIEEDMFLFEYRGEALKKIPLVCYLPKEDSSLCTMTCPVVLECTSEAIPEALRICNRLNLCCPAANIHIDDDNQVCISSVLRPHKEYFCEDIMQALSYLAEAADATYMQFQEEMEIE